MSRLLAEQPRDVAERIVDPSRGLARSVEFLSLAAVSKWCEGQSAHVYAEIERKRRAEAQIASRLEWKDAPRPQSLIQKASAWLNRTDPVAQQLAGEETAKRRNSDLLAEAAARRVREVRKEWGGEDVPTIGGFPISRELANSLKGKGQCG